MFDIRPLDSFHPERFRKIATGYVTTEIYRVTRHESEEQTTFTVALEALDEAQTFRFPMSDEELQHYQAIVPGDYCLGAVDDATVVGIALAEAQAWNNTLWVWEFHVEEPYRGQGVGRALMEALVERAKAANLRAVVCETQNTNVPAIRFYRAAGFEMEGVDISYYTNQDMMPGNTVAVFMKRRLK